MDIQLIEAGKNPQNSYIVANGRDLHSSRELGDDYELFWEHLEKYLNQKIPRDIRAELEWSFSC